MTITLKPFEVQHCYDGEWVTGVREDLYDGTNDDALEKVARFDTRQEAETYIEIMCGLMHMGGNQAYFRILEHDEDGATVL